MNDNPNVSNVAPNDPYSDMEFDVFLKNIGNAKLTTWKAFAKLLGVSTKTIERWRKHPLAQSAMIEAVANDLEQMTRVGKDDWKMWREHAKIMGVEDEQVIKHQTSEADVSLVLQALEKTNYDELARKAQGQMVAPKQPVQDQNQGGQS